MGFCSFLGLIYAVSPRPQDFVFTAAHDLLTCSTNVQMSSSRRRSLSCSWSGKSPVNELARYLFNPLVDSAHNISEEVGAKLHIYIPSGRYVKRLFRGPSTNDIHEKVGWS